MEWFDFGVYGFVAYALGVKCSSRADPSLQMIAALGTFSVPSSFAHCVVCSSVCLVQIWSSEDHWAITIVIMSISAFCIGLIRLMLRLASGPILLLLCKMAQSSP